MEPHTTPLISLAGIRHEFSGVAVLKDVDLAVYPGQVHGLVGENGAGKSTLMKLLIGVHRLQTGTIEIDGRKVVFGSPADARASGIGMVFQEFSLVPTFTVAQNVLLHNEPRNRLGVIREGELHRRAEQLFQRMGVDIDVTQTMSELGPAQWQLTEIAKALAGDVKLLILDEPTSTLTRTESAALFALVRHLTAQGIGVVYISHRMEEILAICDQVTVLRDGSRVLSEPASALTVETMIEAIVGRAATKALAFQGNDSAVGPERLGVSGLRAGRVNGVSFEVAAGEVLGIVGLVGSGRSEVLRAIFGLDRRTAGEVRIDGEPRAVRRPSEAMRAGIALVPEDRRREGLIVDHPIRSNILLAMYRRLHRGPVVDDHQGDRHAVDVSRRVGLRARSLRDPVRLLSGGNQQKAVVAKWLGRQPSVLLLDEPTAGIDIGAKTEIVELIRQLAAGGTSIVMVSSDLPEILAVCDRILIMRDGAVHHTMRRTDIQDDAHLQRLIQAGTAA